MTFDFTGQTVIVTGAAHGFGRVIALAFASRGAHVWACDILAEELQVTARLCAQMRGSCTTRVVDVRSKTEVEAFVRQVSAGTSAMRSAADSAISAVQSFLTAESAENAESASGADAAANANSANPANSAIQSPSTAEFAENAEKSADANAAALENSADSAISAVQSFFTAESAETTAHDAPARHIDILVNNAGGVLGQVGRPLEEISPADWQSIFDVNVTGAFYMSQAVAPGMKRAGRGRIVNISSGAGLGISLTGIQAYASAKAAQIGLTRQLAHELGPFGITVNNIAPGFVRSNPTTERQWESYGAEGQAALIDRIALKRLGTPDDIAHGVLFFASDYAGWITGQILSIDGGK